MSGSRPDPLVALPADPPLTRGACATLACIWEATAPKPGNVYRGADFADLTYVDFLASAAAMAPVIDAAADAGVGATVLNGVQVTRAVIGPRNTNLGILLLLSPLAAAPPNTPLADGVRQTLARLNQSDARDVYAAIRLVQPGGLGRADRGDVNDVEAPAVPLLEAMQLAADRDLVARQYASGFQEVFATADRIERHAAKRPLGEAIVRSYLELLRDCPDSLIARKCGLETARAISSRVGAALDAHCEDQFDMMLADLDFWLRSDGNRLNPGTSADIIAAALFVLLLEKRINWPVQFY